MSFKFREHRGQLADSMETVVVLEDRAALIDHLNSLFNQWQLVVTPEQVTVAPYHYDDRIEWDTHIVTIEGYGVAGFTDKEVR